MSRLRHALWPAGLAFGVAAEWIGRPELIGLDAAAGFSLIFLGLAAWAQRPQSRAGAIMTAAGFAWFLGTLWSPAVYLNRGPLAHLLLSYPQGRLSSRLERLAVGAAYAYAAAYPVAGSNYATIAFALALIALATHRYVISRGPERRACLTALTAATAFGLVLILGATTRIDGLSAERAVLFAYDLVVLLIAVGLFADLLWGPWAQATVTRLVVDLGDTVSAGPLRNRLARTLGDPTLVVAYRLPEATGYVDEAGRPVELPATGGERTVTPIDQDGARVAVLVHDSAVLNDPELISAVAAATRLAISNARLQTEVRVRVDEVDASRRRIVAAGDEQRRRLERELRQGAQRRLARVAELLMDVDPELERQLVEAQAELGEFGRGTYPATLTEYGLGAALRELAERSPFPVELVVSSKRSRGPVEAAAYFVCSEGLANVAKYASASRVRIRVAREDERLIVEVADDGVGGADPSVGSGLRGLADRVEALGGRLGVESPLGRGTRLLAELPVQKR
jgi:signal transduction histidine kinase